MNALSSIPVFTAVDADPGGTLKRFNDYIEEMKLLFTLVFSKSDGTAYAPTDDEKKSMTLLKGGKDMRILFAHVAGVLATDTFAQAVTKVKDKLGERTNKVVQRNMLLSNFPQGSKSFEKWSQQISEAAQLIDYTNYDWKQAAVDAILLQTTHSKLREKAIQDNVGYDDLLKIGIAKEQSEKGAALLEQAAGHSSGSHVEEKVRRLQLENQRLRNEGRDSEGFRKKDKKTCTRCGYTTCNRGKRCPANGQRCTKCNGMNHFARTCMSKKKGKEDRVQKTFGRRQNVAQLSSDEQDDSEESSGRILVRKLDTRSLLAEVKVQGTHSQSEVAMQLVTDTGISKTLLNFTDWSKIKSDCQLVRTSKRFRPYGTAYHLPIIGRAHVNLSAVNGASIKTWVYIVKDKHEQSLLGNDDATRLGIVSIDLKGATTEVVNRITPITKDDPTPPNDPTKQAREKRMKGILDEFPLLFSDKTGKFKGPPIKIHVKDSAIPLVQPPRRIPLQYVERTKAEIERMVKEDIIEGPLEIEEPGTFISNLVITDKKGTDKIRVTLDCQAVNREIHPTHEPMPTTEELRHHLQGSDCFSTLDMTNCYHQFKIEEQARKLYAFRTPWGIFRYKRMVMGTSPASSEVQKRIRETIKLCKNSIHIKDDILVFGTEDTHDTYLREVLKTLQSKGITLRPEKCDLGKEEVKWFGNIYSKHGMSPDPDKCSIIKNWPSPTSGKEVKSFLQTVQFNAKFLGSLDGDESYPELTAPLCKLTKKNIRFYWGEKEEIAFTKLKDRLCSSKVIAPYETHRKTRLHVDSSPVGTQATVAQLHAVDGKPVWRPVNHTSRAWTPAESRYGQIERESNGILTGMYMNKMYTLGTHVEVVTDHEPLLPIYNSPARPKQLRVDRHRTKLLPFDYTVLHEPGTESPCDYGSRHPPSHKLTATEREEWCVETGTDIYVNCVIDENLPEAITMKELREASEKDPIISKLISLIGKPNCANDPSLKAFKHIFTDLWTTQGILMRNDQIVIPASLQCTSIQIAHEGHQYADKTLKLLRQTCWFPNMNEAVIEYVSTCRPCLAASHHNPPVPLQPNFLPDRPWQKLHGDFKGPIAGSYYLHIVIDQYSKYPEVDILTSTSFKKLRPVLDRIIATHGVPETLTTDNGPPYPSHEMESYAKQMGFTLTPVTPDDPQSNGFAENFVKQICKLIHTASAEGKDPKAELYTFLLQYRATPHSTTGKSPAEMLFNRRIKTKLPQISTRKETPEQKRTVHDEKKLRQKRYFDKRYRARPKHIHPGDRVLMKQTKSTTKPPFDPLPFTVTSIKGNQVTITDGDRVRVRDKNKLKVIRTQPPYLLKTQRWQSRNNLDTDIQINTQSTGEPRHQVATTETQVFVPSNDMNAHLQQLLDAAENRSTAPDEGQASTQPIAPPGRVTRSHGKALQWNPVMNSSDVILEGNH